MYRCDRHAGRSVERDLRSVCLNFTDGRADSFSVTYGIDTRGADGIVPSDVNSGGRRRPAVVDVLVVVTLIAIAVAAVILAAGAIARA